MVGRDPDNKFAASSCWYGGGIAGTKDERPNCPVQMHFGEKDASIPMTDVEAVRAAQPKAESLRLHGRAARLRLRRAGQLQQARLRACAAANLGILRQAARLIAAAGRTVREAARARPSSGERRNRTAATSVPVCLNDVGSAVWLGGWRSRYGRW